MTHCLEVKMLNGRYKLITIITVTNNSLNECRLIHSISRVNNYFNRFMDECVQ